MRLTLRSHRSGLVAGAVAVIVVGVGLAAVVFALADAYVWRPLPYANSDRLVSIAFDMSQRTPGAWNDVTQEDIPSLSSWQARTDLFEGVAAFDDRGWTRVQLSGGILPIRAIAASDNLLQVLGLGPRWASSDPADAWVSNRTARTLSGGQLEPGRSAPIIPDGTLRVRAILPDSFLLPEPNRTQPVDALTILPPGPVMTKDGASTSWPDIVARLRPGVTPDVVEAALSATLPARERVSVVPLAAAMTARVRSLASGAMLASALVLLVCWANVFGMALTRGLYRRAEIATRTALGATMAHISGLFAREGLNVAAFGAAGAFVVTWLTLAVARLVLPPQFATLGAPFMTTRVVFVVLVAAGVGGACWSLALLLAWRFAGMRQARTTPRGDARTIRIARFALVMGEVAIACTLLANAALLGRSYLNLLDIDLGMDERAQTLTVALDADLPAARRDLEARRVLTALQKVPGVQAAGLSYRGLLDGRNSWGTADIDGRVILFPDFTVVAGDYFDAMGLQFVAGGPPQRHDTVTVVINETMALQYFGQRSPIGDVIGLHDGTTAAIAGVVRDVRSTALTRTPTPALFRAERDTPSETQVLTVTYVVRPDPRASLSLGTWERVVHGVDPMAVVLDSGTIGDRIGRSIRDRTFPSLVAGLFALACVTVTSLSVAGVVAYAVVRRTREIAIRRALGATGASVTRLVVREVVTAGACGIAAGLLVSLWLSQGLVSVLYGISPTDPLTLLVAAASLLAIVLVAATRPALRAVRIEPAAALRVE
jgi:predicted permease